MANGVSGMLEHYYISSGQSEDTSLALDRKGGGRGCGRRPPIGTFGASPFALLLRARTFIEVSCITSENGDIGNTARHRTLVWPTLLICHRSHSTPLARPCGRAPTCIYLILERDDTPRVRCNLARNVLISLGRVRALRKQDVVHCMRSPRVHRKVL